MQTKRSKYCIYLITYNNFLFIKSWEFANKSKKTVFINDFIGCKYNIKQPLLFLIEILLSCVLMTYWFAVALKYLLIKLLSFNRRYTSFKKLYINSDNGLRTAVQKKLIQKDEYVLAFPYKFKANIVCNRVEITEISSYATIFFSIFDCIKSLFIFTRKKGVSSCVYLFTSFDFFLLYNALNHLDRIEEVLISNQKDRWAYMIGSLKFYNKTIIQHGTVIGKGTPMEYMNSYVKYSKSDELFYLNMPYKLTGFNKIISFTPLEYKYMLLSEHKTGTKIKNECVGYNLELTPVNDDIRSILIVGNSNQYAFEEKQLILYFNNNVEFKLFLKPHPAFSKAIYKEYSKLDNFTLLSDTTYPKVNYVVSYCSTLALEYESLGIKVIYYSDIMLNNSGRISFELLLKYLM